MCLSSMSPPKHILIIAILAVVTPALAPAQVVPTDLPRVGASISATEREYFHLFRNVEGYIRTDLIPATGNGVGCTVLRRSGDTLEWKLDSLEHAVFGAWIQHYEVLSLAGDTMIQALRQILGADHPSDKLRAISRLHARGIIDIARDRFEEPLRPGLVTYSGDTLRHPLLTVSESALFLWDGDGMYDATKVDGHLRRIPADSIHVLTMPASVPFGTAATFATYTIWSGLLHWISRESTGNDKGNIPVAGAAMVFPLPSVIPGLFLGWLVSIPEYPRTYSTDTDSLAVKRSIPALIPYSLFGANVPPEFHAHAVTGEGGMRVYGDGDAHPYENLGCADCDFEWMLGLETMAHVYDVHKRPTSTHMGLSISRSIPLTRLGENARGWHLTLRPRVAAGTYFTTELSLELLLPTTMSVLAGLAYTHVYEDLGISSSGNVTHLSYTSWYERNSLFQETFAILGLSFATSYGRVELQYRHVLEPALHEQVEAITYGVPESYKLTVFDIKRFGGVSIALHVRW